MKEYNMNAASPRTACRICFSPFYLVFSLIMLTFAARNKNCNYGNKEI